MIEVLSREMGWGGPPEQLGRRWEMKQCSSSCHVSLLRSQGSLSSAELWPSNVFLALDVMLYSSNLLNMIALAGRDADTLLSVGMP